MKLKRLPDDFQVEEQISLPLAGGRFAVYRLTKQSLGTLEAVDAIRSKWNLESGRIEFAGLKDKHARTIQFLTIDQGPRKSISQTNLSLDYVGQSPRAIHASYITANRFVVAIRDLSESEIESARRAINSVAQHGLPNYFDNQRFGSVGESGEFIAKPWCLGDYDRALWLALADPNARDRPQDRKAKQIWRDHWHDWQTCLSSLPDSDHRQLAQHLNRHPNDYRRSIAMLPHALRSLWLAAFQSHLWNQVLSKFIVETCGHENCTSQQIGRSNAVFFQQLSSEQRDELQRTVLPLPSARLHLSDETLKPLYDGVLAAEGLELRQVRVKYPRDTFFSKAERPALFCPEGFLHDFADDDVYAGRRKLVLQFTLPRGCYATILVKKIAGGPAEELMSLSDER